MCELCEILNLCPTVHQINIYDLWESLDTNLQLRIFSNLYAYIFLFLIFHAVFAWLALNKMLQWSVVV